METTGLEERISSLQKSLHDKASKLTASQEKIKELVVQLKEVSLVDFRCTPLKLVEYLMCLGWLTRRFSKTLFRSGTLVTGFFPSKTLLLSDFFPRNYLSWKWNKYCIFKMVSF